MIFTRRRLRFPSLSLSRFFPGSSALRGRAAFGHYILFGLLISKLLNLDKTETRTVLQTPKVISSKEKDKLDR